MKQAKATEKDIQDLRNFLTEMEKHISGEINYETVEDLLNAMTFPTGWRRVVEGYQVLIENTCDPTLDYLEWKPDLKQLVDCLEKSPGALAILSERLRQINKEGWTPEHDDEHTRFEMSDAAIVYAAPLPKDFLWVWPWDDDWYRPSTKIRNLEKAGALIAAEIDRLKRLDPEILKTIDEKTGKP